MQNTQDRVITALMEQLIKARPEDIAEAFNFAMRMERDLHLGAGRCERAEARRRYANGYKPNMVGMPAGTVTVWVPKRRDGDEMTGRGHRLQKAKIAGHAADVFRRPTPLIVEQAGEGHIRGCCADRLMKRR